MSETTSPKPRFTSRTTKPGYWVSFDGRRTVGSVVYHDMMRKAHGSGLWTARRGDGTRVGSFATRGEAAEALRPRSMA